MVLTINGNGKTITQRSGAQTVRMTDNNNTVVINDLIIDGAGSKTTYSSGGSAVYVRGGTVSIEHSVIKNCETTASSYGGAVTLESGTLNLTGCSFINNKADDYGGAVDVEGTSTTLYATNCTFYGNKSNYDGGAIYTFSAGGGEIKNCTIVGNTAGSHGGGIHIAGNTTTATRTTVKNCIVIGNTIGGSTTSNNGPDIYTATDGGYNLYGKANGTFSKASSSTSGVAYSNNWLAQGAPTDNGGNKLPTIALLEESNSPALNKLSSSAGAPAVDQRGIARDATPDIGAFEFAVALPSEYHVNTAAEFSYAMSNADSSTPIYIEDDFDSVDNPALSSADRTITIYGQGHTIEQSDGGVTAHVEGTGNRIEIYDLTIDGAGGAVTNKNGGGALYLESGDVYLEDVTIRDCSVEFVTGNVGTEGLKYGGGAVSVALYDPPNKNISNGSVTAVNCSFVGNSVGQTYDAPGGGALSADQVFLTNCTFWDNSAVDSMGGAVYARLGGSLTNCTVVNNFAGLSGGGATARTESVNGGYTMLRLLNCIVVDNRTGGTVGKSATNVDQAYDQGGNVIGYVHTVADATYRDAVYSNNGTRIPADGSVWNITDGVSTWLEYGAPKMNGGKTPTIALKDAAAGPVINHGVASGIVESYYTALVLSAPDTDQRGESRDATPDIGAYEYTGALTPPVNFDALDAKLTVAKAIPQGVYTSATWNALTSAIAEAEGVRAAADATQAAVNDALTTLTAAYENLLQKASLGNLSALEIVVKSYEDTFPESDYTADSWVDFGKALADAKAILGSPDDYVDADVTAAGVALYTTADTLVRKVDKSGLQEAVSAAEALLAPENRDKYIQVSIDNLSSMIAAAKNVLNNANATQDEVYNAFGNLANAVSEMFESGDKAALQAFVNLVGGVTGAHYTPVSYQSFTDSLAAANVVLTNLNALQKDVNTALTNLQNAFTGLVRKADTAALSASVKQAQEIVAKAEDYVSSSLEGLEDTLDAAIAVLDDLNASQSEVNSARTKLNERILAARMKAERSALLAALNTASALNQLNYTRESLVALNIAIQGGSNIMNAPIESVTQEQVDQAVVEIYRAISALALIENDDPDTGATKPSDENSDTSDVNDTNGASDTGSNNGASDTGSNNGASDTGSNNGASDTGSNNSTSDTGGASGTGNAVDASGVSVTDGAAGAGDTSSSSGARSANGTSGTGSTDGGNTRGAGSARGANSTSSVSGTSGASSTNGASSTSNTSGANSMSGGASSSQTTDMIDADVETIDDSEGAEVAAMVPFSSPEIIADTDIPLAGVAVQDATQGGFSAWWIAATLLAGLLVGACAMFIVLKRLRRKNDASEATGKNQL